MAEKKSNGSGSHTKKARGLDAMPVGPRKRQYLIAPRLLPGLAPLATDAIASALDTMPDIEVVKRI